MGGYGSTPLEDSPGYGAHPIGGADASTPHPGGFWDGVAEAARNLPDSFLETFKRGVQSTPGAPSSGPAPKLNPQTGRYELPRIDPVGEVKGWWEGVKQRYGSVEQALESAKKDPAGVALDLALLTKGAAGAGEAGLNTAPGQAVARAADATATGVKAAVPAAAKAAAPDVLRGAAKVGTGAAIDAMGLPGHVGTIVGATGGVPQIARGVAQGAKAGFAAGKDALLARLEELKQAAGEASAAAAAPEVIPPSRQLGPGPIITPPPADTSGPIPGYKPNMSPPITAGPVKMPAPQPNEFRWPGEMNIQMDPENAPVMPQSQRAPIKFTDDQFAQIGRQKKATALAQVLDHAGVNADDLAQLPLKEQTKHLGDLVKELKINQTGQISADSIEQTLFELRKLQKGAQEAKQ